MMDKYIIRVYHQQFNTTGKVDGFLHVANVYSAAPIETQNESAALEYAWRQTNNIEGSWSREFKIDGVINDDFNPNVEVIQPNEVIDGKEYGQRSSMIGDVFTIGAKRFVVAACGFEEYKGEFDYA